ncbi:hypothetical protein FNV43_RR03481 [Rhamnella rubrinervis]|uniref:SAM domain-containing protein n=1 Tax=Rhamnella rubrinervis TaxID=2594499 RepID=A0A8K0HJ80_9ROSA|nr:hypothetical protein FNV43_RR03481 [Rhamnella rubrinervis]
MDWFSWLSKTSLDTSLVYEYGVVFARNELQFKDISYFNHEFLQSMGISVAKHRLEILKLAKKERPKSLSRLVLAISRTRQRFSNYFSKLGFHAQAMEMSAKEFTDSTAQSQQQYWRSTGALMLRKQGSQELKEKRPVSVIKNRSIALSGPLDGRVQERLTMSGNSNCRSLKLSGPLDGKLQDRYQMYTNRSPRFHGTPDGFKRALVPERVMPNTTTSPKLSGPQDAFSVTNRSLKISGPLDGRAVSPRLLSPYEKKEKEYVLDYDDEDDHSLWTTLFQDMKPT